MNNFRFALFFIPLLLQFCSPDTSRNEAPSKLFEYRLSQKADKIWAHRVDRISDAKSKAAEFNGIEVDLFYNALEDDFYVRHDEDAPDTLKLDVFLDSVLTIKDYYFWFDFKNLESDIVLQQISRLSAILSEHGIGNRCFIESTNTTALDIAGKYIPCSFWIPKSEELNTEKEQKILAKQILRRIKDTHIKMLSADYRYYPFFEKYFPDYKVNLWMIGEPDAEKLNLLNVLAQKKNVNIILIDRNTNYLSTR
jgi:hypothetical protein